MDEITVKLPVSGKEVVLRNYTTHKDDEKAEAILFMGVAAEQKFSETQKASDQKISFPVANMTASRRSYIPRLVQSIGGETTNLKDVIDSLRTEDYEVLEQAVEKIVEENSPKAREAKKASNASTK